MTRDIKQETAHLQNHWAKTPEYNQDGYEGFKTDRREKLAELIMSFNPKSILEIGCLGGYNLREIHKLDPSITLTGFDINDKALEYAKSKLNNLETIHGSLYDLDQVLGDKTFDIIFTAGVLIHIPCWDINKSEVDTEYITQIATDIAKHANLGVVHAEEHHSTFYKLPHKGMRYAHNFNTLYDNLSKSVEITEAPNASNGFEHFIKVTL